MSDWRLNGQEAYLSGATVYKITFPEFWEEAYRTKNVFYQRIADYANDTVKRTGKWAELLEGDNVQHFWHQHCDFCWEKALTDKPGTFYCTKDRRHWICEECFRDFHEKFHWQVNPTDELLK